MKKKIKKYPIFFSHSNMAAPVIFYTPPLEKDRENAAKGFKIVASDRPNYTKFVVNALL